MTEPDDPLLAEVKRLLDRPETRYLLERARAGLLTPDEEVQVAQLRKLLAMLTAWRRDDEARRPFLDRLYLRARRAFRRTERH